MDKILLILKHEFTTLVTGKSFIIMTILFPLIGFIAIGITQLVQTSSQPDDVSDIHKIGYVDEAGELSTMVPVFENIKLVPFQEQNDVTNAFIDGSIEEYFIIPSDYLQSGRIIRYHSHKELEISGATYAAIRTFLLDNLLKGQSRPEIVERVKYPLFLSNVRLNKSGELATDQGGVSTFLVPMVFGFLLVIAIGASSGTLLQGMGEEKQNRIMEVLLSSVSTRQLLLGKVLGLGSGGLLQILFWLASISILIPLASTTIGGLFTTIRIPENIVILGLVYFILGYLFFAIMQAGLGAIVANPKESPQIAVAFILPAVLPFYVAILFLRNNPDHVIGTILTLFPVTAPMSVFVRMGLSEIPAWELALSILILLLSIVGALVLAAKTFRVFLLMHGKTPKFKEIIRMLRQA